MNRFLYTARAVCVGLFITQIIATLHVYLSNGDLYRTIVTISDAGYLAIPNRRVLSTLNGFGPAFYGAWFFTLSIGAGLSIFAVCCAWVWDRIFGRHWAFLVPLGLLWLATLLAVNRQAFPL